MAKNVRSQKQFRGAPPQEPVDEWNRSNRMEPNSPSSQKSRNGLNLGSQTQARPGLVGMQDYSRKGKRKGKK